MEPLRLMVRPVEAAAMMGLGRSKVYELIAAGVIPSVRIGKSVRIPMDALRHWIEAHTSGLEQHSTANAVDVTKTPR